MSKQKLPKPLYDLRDRKDSYCVGEVRPKSEQPLRIRIHSHLTKLGSFVILISSNTKLVLLPDYEVLLVQ